MCQETTEFINTEEVARIMGKCRYTIQTRYKKLGLTAYRVGRELKFDKTEVYEVIRKGKIIHQDKPSSVVTPKPHIKLVD